VGFLGKDVPFLAVLIDFLGVPVALSNVRNPRARLPERLHLVERNAVGAAFDRPVRR
jgi:hypothetical protein